MRLWDVRTKLGLAKPPWLGTTDLHPQPTGLSQSQGNRGSTVVSELLWGTAVSAGSGPQALTLGQDKLRHEQLKSLPPLLCFLELLSHPLGI